MEGESKCAIQDDEYQRDPGAGSCREHCTCLLACICVCVCVCVCWMADVRVGLV